MKSLPNMFGDRLVNLISGTGVLGKDKSVGNTYTDPVNNIHAHRIMYRTSWFARRVVDTPANDMTRQWRTFMGSAQAVKDISVHEKALKYANKVNEAIIAARLEGVSYLMPITASTRVETPMREGNMRANGLRGLLLITKDELKEVPSSLVTDISNPMFGQHELYEYLPRQSTGGLSMPKTRVHHTRLHKFTGATLHWKNHGDSVLQYCGDAIEKADSAMAQILGLMGEAKVDVISVPQLADMLSTAEGVEKVKKRFQEGMQIKTVYGVQLLGNGESWERKQIHFAGLVDIVRMAYESVSGAAEVPVSRLMGQSARGLNATGRGDLDNYFMSIQARQKLGVSSAIRELDKLLVRSANVEGIEVDDQYWHPLSVPTPQEAAEANERNAKATEIYARLDFIPPEAFGQSVIDGLDMQGVYPQLAARVEATGEKVELSAPALPGVTVSNEAVGGQPEPEEVDDE